MYQRIHCLVCKDCIQKTGCALHFSLSFASGILGSYGTDGIEKPRCQQRQAKKKNHPFLSFYHDGCLMSMTPLETLRLVWADGAI